VLASSVTDTSQTIFCTVLASSVTDTSQTIFADYKINSEENRNCKHMLTVTLSKHCDDCSGVFSQYMACA